MPGAFRWLRLSDYLNPLLSKRSVINSGVASSFLYSFIDHFKVADSAVGPVGSNFTATTKTWMQLIDSDGWPNDPSVSGTAFGAGIRIPISSDFAGPYVLTWTGDGEVRFQVGTWTVDTGQSTNYTEVSNGRYTNTAGLTARIVVSHSGITAGANLVPVQFTLTDPNTTGRYLRNFKFYRLADESRLQAGKTFRTPFLQSLVNLNPAAIRVMDWHGGNDNRNNRFENRNLPSNAGWQGRTNWMVSPAYGKAAFVDGVNANQYTLSAVSTGTRQTTASMTHGEIVTCLLNIAAVRAGTFTGGNVFKTVTSISKASNGRVVCTAHGFNTGDKIIHIIPSGMTQLNKFPCTITKIDADTYDLNVNTTGFGTFPGNVTFCAGQFITLQVGSGSDRTSYPILFPNTSYCSLFGDGYLTLRQYQTFVFDKTISGYNDSGGNPVFGVWFFTEGGGPHDGCIPAEICTALVNEVNELALSQGKTNTTHLWICIPAWSMLSMDPDYSAGSNFATKALDVVLNGANGYAGLAAPASVLVEYSNETWNTGGTSFSQSTYLATRGFQRWPSTSSASDFASMTALRSTVMARDIKAALSNNPRIKYVMAGQGALGYNTSNLNELRCIGTTSYLTDSLVTGGSYGTPISNHDAFAHATYFDAGDDTHYYNSQFATDSALYATGVPANQTTAIASFVAAVVGGSGQSCNSFCSVATPSAGVDATFASAMVTAGKVSIKYEGGPDWKSKSGDSTWAGITLSSADQTFLEAVQLGSAWATAQINYFNATTSLSGSAMPSVFVIVGDVNGNRNIRWAHASPDTYASATEGQGLLNSASWVAQGSRNQGLSP